MKRKRRLGIGGERQASTTVIIKRLATALVIAAFLCIAFRQYNIAHRVIDAPPLHYSLQPRVFLPQNISNLCIPQDYYPGIFESIEPSNDGLLFVKIKKSGSSSLAGVAARIAHATANNRTQICKSRMTHEWFYQVKLNERNKKASFLWTILRRPETRALSYFFFEDVGRNGKHPSTAIYHLKQVSNFQLQSISNAKAPGRYTLERVMPEFDFIGILERLDESLVLLQLLLGLQVHDVLYLNAKQSGGYDPHHNCSIIPKTSIAVDVKEYLMSDEWNERNKADYWLYELVNQSMDLTIDSIGRGKFEKALQEFQELKKVSNAHCEYKSPCIGEGMERPKGDVNAECYAVDWGCGYKCIDRLFSQRQLSLLE
jgi:hypothetical protein